MQLWRGPRGARLEEYKSTVVSSTTKRRYIPNLPLLSNISLSYMCKFTFVRQSSLIDCPMWGGDECGVQCGVSGI